MASASSNWSASSSRPSVIRSARQCSAAWIWPCNSSNLSTRAVAVHGVAGQRGDFGVQPQAGHPAEKRRGRQESRARGLTRAQTENLQGRLRRVGTHRKHMAMLRKTQRVASGRRRAKTLTTGDLHSVVGSFGSANGFRTQYGSVNGPQALSVNIGSECARRHARGAPPRYFPESLHIGSLREFGLAQAPEARHRAVLFPRLCQKPDDLIEVLVSTEISYE